MSCLKTKLLFVYIIAVCVYIRAFTVSTQSSYPINESL